MRQWINLCEDQLDEAMTITTQTGRDLIVLKNPTRPAFENTLKKWSNGARVIIDHNGDVYMADAWYVYHYQLIKALGLPDDCEGFRAYENFIGLNWNDRMDQKAVARMIKKVQNNKWVRRIYGDEAEVRNIAED